MDSIYMAMADSGHMALLLGYIDPGTGSMLIQVLAATLISAGLFFKGARDRLTMAFFAVFRARSAETKAVDAQASEKN